MASVRWSGNALRDLNDIVAYYRVRSRAYGAALSRRITAATRQLRFLPSMGRVVPEYNRDSIRELIVGPYRVLHQLKEDEIGVIAVVHGSRDLPTLLGDEPGEPRRA